tara:strand:- start:424 stop:714 length:291 start_codon:yes stop_codon:yes gene_type:complete
MSKDKVNKLTTGQFRVGVDFNPSGNVHVDFVKEQLAQMIDYIYEHGRDNRCNDASAINLESAAMWAVKSITKREIVGFAVAPTKEPSEPGANRDRV